MRITFLGTGTSQGIPIIGCPCAVCSSPDPRDNRLRVSIWIEIAGKSLVVDVGPDFRQQMLRAGVRRLDALLITHAHRDHIAGLDDIRPFNFQEYKHLPVYADERVQAELRQSYRYIFEASYPGVPMVELRPIERDTPFSFEDIDIIPIQYWHGELPIFGFRIGKFAYLTDFKRIDGDQLEKLRGVEVLAISGLHYEPHHSHSTIPETVAFIQQLQPQPLQAWIIHMSHSAGKHADIEATLPPTIRLAYDGLVLDI